MGVYKVGLEGGSICPRVHCILKFLGVIVWVKMGTCFALMVGLSFIDFYEFVKYFVYSIWKIYVFLVSMYELGIWL